MVASNRGLKSDRSGCSVRNPNPVMKLPTPPKSLGVFLSHAKVFWKQWNVQSMVLTSFIIQLILIFIVPFRKHTSNWVIISTVWLSYLLADWVAIQSIGLISDPCSSTSTSDKELYAFWAQFLLLHLGGPDTITALALEDNELWLRTGLHLGVQVYGGLGILVKSVAHSHTSLWLPTLLMFTAGVIKYSERISSLFRGRLPRIYLYSEFDPGTHEIHYFMEEDQTDAALPYDAFHLFYLYKDFFMGIPKFSPYGWEYMSTKTPEQAFQVLEIVFNLAYEVFYTKTVLICTKLHWKVLRLVVTVLQAGSLVIWLFFTDKGGFKEYNIRVTNTLLVGAIAVDVYSFLRIQLWSDWTIVQRGPSKRDLLWRFHNKVLSARKRTWGRYKRQEDAPLRVRFRRAFFRRWSDSIHQLGLVSLWMDEPRLEKVLGFVTCVGVGSCLEQRKYVRKKWFSDYVRDFLFEDIKEKVNTEGGAQNIGRVKGGWACVSLMSNYQTDMISIPNICKLLDTRTDYNLTVMWWHTITELCYHDDQLSHDIDTSDQDDNLVKRLFNKMLSKPNNDNATTTNGSGNKNNGKECDYKEICKILSDYMMYLLVHQPDMVSLPAFTKIRLGKEYRRFKGKLSSMAPAERKSKMRYHASREIREFGSACFGSQDLSSFNLEEIVGELKELEEKQIGKWEFIAKVWSELLCYAAINCNPCLHAAKLKEGGELLSFIWMLLWQMGIGLTESSASIHRVELGKALLHTSVNDGETHLDRFDLDEV